MSFVCCPVVKGRGQNFGLELEGYIQWMKGTDATNPLSSWGQLYAFPAPEKKFIFTWLSLFEPLPRASSNLVELVYPITLLFS